MSRIGKKPILIPEGVTVSLEGDNIIAKGKNGTISVPKTPWVSVKINGQSIEFSPENKTKQAKSNWGTLRALVQNAVYGASENFSKQLIIEGVGYRASVEGKVLNMNLGYSHPIEYKIPDGIEISVEKNTIKISGSDKALVGEVAAQIRSFRKPEPYKGKGIRYSDEKIRRKSGKKAVGAGSK